MLETTIHFLQLYRRFLIVFARIPFIFSIFAIKQEKSIVAKSNRASSFLRNVT